MKLCIVKQDGTIAEVAMGERQPSLETLNNELLFFENYQYKIIIRGSEKCNNLELFVGDYSVRVHYNSATDCYETEFELVFGGCFDLASISVYFDDGEGDEKAFYTDFLRIATTKQTAKQVEQMLGEIEENLPNFLEVCFSRNKKKSGLIKNDVRSIWNTLKIVDEIIKIYEENYSHFSNHKKASVEPVAAIVDAEAMRMIDQESLRWIACNPDNLIQTDKVSGIVVDQRSYIPSKVKTYLSQYSYDIYENRVVLGFLQNVIDYLESQISGFSKEIMELENIPESIIVQLPNTHELTGRCVYIYYKRVLERFFDKQTILQEIYYRYEKVLECSAELVYGMPKLTNTFKQVYHYRLCYEYMVKWFESGDYTFDHLNYLFKLKTLSRIFEYYCLVKMQSAILLCGYAFREASRVIYDMEDDTEDINNQYVFSGNGYELTLLYEPCIWVDKVNKGINLYSTGYNFFKAKWNDRWTPDFILKVSGIYNDYYYIFDAKYSNELNVKKYYISELILKYSTQIASKDKFFSDVIGVGALYPGEENKMFFFKKNAVGSRKQSLPEYFSLAIVGENTGNVILKERLSELLKIVEKIEQEKENTIILRGNLIQMDSLANVVGTQNSNLDVKPTEIKKDKVMLNKASDAEEMNSQTDKEDVERPIVISSGKKCFYYAKSLCLCQKTRCTINDMPCEHYLPKNAKELLKEEDSCRNFIRYTRRGKVIRVECSISGLPGCVGSKECKFCLKKNERKQ